MPREEIAFTARPKIHSQSQIFRYSRSIFCLSHRPNFSDILDLCLHWVSVQCPQSVIRTDVMSLNIRGFRFRRWHSALTRGLFLDITSQEWMAMTQNLVFASNFSNATFHCKLFIQPHNHRASCTQLLYHQDIQEVFPIKNNNFVLKPNYSKKQRFSSAILLT